MIENRPGVRLQRRAQAILVSAALGLVYCPAAQPHPEIHERMAGVSGEIREHPSNATLYLRRGELRRFHGELAAAEADYKRARRLNSGLASVDLCLGSLRDDQRRYEDAVVAFDRYVAKRPGDPAEHAAREALARLNAALARVGEKFYPDPRGVPAPAGGPR